MPTHAKVPKMPADDSGKMQKAKRKREVKAPEVRRSELLQAAAALFDEKGVAATAIGDITDRAQVAKGTFYIYFSSKDELIAEMWKDYVAGFMRVADEVEFKAGSKAPDPAKVLHLIERLTLHALEHAELHRIVYTSADAPALALCKQSDERIIERLVKAVNDNLPSPGTAQTLQASMIFYGLDGALHRAIMSDSKIDRLSFAHSVKQFASNALGLQDTAS